MKAQLAVAVLAMAMITACGKDEGTAKLAFAEGNANALTYQPTTLRMKLIAAYLSEDIAANQSNSGVTSMFYLNSACGDDIMHCDVSAGTAEDGAPIDKVVTDYFDFSPSANVNAALNAQARSVEAATYKYVRLEFCKYNAARAPTVQWGGSFGGTTVSGEFAGGACTVNSAQLEPPLTIEAGDAATVTLSYSTVGLVADGQGTQTDANCVSAGGQQYCLTLPQFNPSASK